MEPSFFDPIKSAKVFLSHSWNDNEISDALYRTLNEVVGTHYDRGNDPLLKIGSPVIDRQAIHGCDFFVFLASPSSMAPDTPARRELDIADAGRPGRRGALGIVALEDFGIPVEYRDAIFERCSTDSLREDCARIVTSVVARLVELGGLGPVADGLAAGANTQRLVDFLSNPSRQGAYPLAAIFSRVEMERIIRALKALGNQHRQRIEEYLADVFLNESNPVARQNAVFILSRITDSSDYGRARSLQSRYPSSVDNPFLYRGFHIALGFLNDRESIANYARNLVVKETREWDLQRDINLRFHLHYYGSREGALADLRYEVQALDPENMLGVDVATLGMLSDDSRDLSLIEEHRSDLLARGVDAEIIDWALRAIRSRVELEGGHRTSETL